MGAQENAHRPTSDFIGPISISNFTPSVLFIWRMHDRIGMVKNTWKAISHLSGYTFNQITIFIEVPCFKRKNTRPNPHGSKENFERKNKKKISRFHYNQWIGRGESILHIQVYNVFLFGTRASIYTKLSTMHATTMNTSSRLFNAAGLR